MEYNRNLMRLRIVWLLVLSLNAMAQSLAPIENDPRPEDRKALHGHARFLGNGDGVGALLTGALPGWFLGRRK